MRSPSNSTWRKLRASWRDSLLLILNQAIYQVLGEPVERNALVIDSSLIGRK